LADGDNITVHLVPAGPACVFGYINRASRLRSKVWNEVTRGESAKAVRLDTYGQSARPDHEPSRVETMQRVVCVPFDAVRGAA